jgi:glycosyltransferase involved in cell wall biosynthesis
VVNHSAARHLGGSEHSMLGLIAAWREQRATLDPVLVSPAAGSAMERAAADAGWQTTVAPYRGWVSFAERESAARRRLERADTAEQVAALGAVLDTVQPALVIMNTVVTPWAAVAAHERGIPVAWFVREFVDDRAGFLLREGRAATLRHVDALATRVLANSEAVRQSIADVIPADRVGVAHPVIDLVAVRHATEHRLRVRERHAAASHGAPSTRPGRPAGPRLRIGLVGRVTPEKGHLIAVEALARLVEQGVDAELDIVGGVILPGFDHELRRRARRRGVAERVHLRGEKQRPLEHLALADVSLVPSPREAFGRVTLESLALGLPVVASTRGGAPEIVEHGVSGALVDVSDPAAVADALSLYAHDLALLAEHRAAAADRAQQVIAGPHGAAATIAELEGLIAAHPPRPADAPTGADARTSLLAGATPLSPTTRAALHLADHVSTTASRVGRLLRDPRTPLRRRWVVLSGRARRLRERRRAPRG